MVEPAKLLDNLGMDWVICDDMFVCIFHTEILQKMRQTRCVKAGKWHTSFLLFVDMANLEPDVGMGERTWGTAEDVVKAAEGFFIPASPRRCCCRLCKKVGHCIRLKELT